MFANGSEVASDRQLPLDPYGETLPLFGCHATATGQPWHRLYEDHIFVPHTSIQFATIMFKSITLHLGG